MTVRNIGSRNGRSICFFDIEPNGIQNDFMGKGLFETLKDFLIKMCEKLMLLSPVR